MFFIIYSYRPLWQRFFFSSFLYARYCSRHKFHLGVHSCTAARLHCCIAAHSFTLLIRYRHQTAHFQTEDSNRLNCIELHNAHKAVIQSRVETTARRRLCCVTTAVPGRHTHKPKNETNANSASIPVVINSPTPSPHMQSSP